jgi:GH35 family endo-1,4-beta-xylanase
VAIDGDAKLYDLAGQNFDEMTAGNAMKYASVVRSDGSMNFTGVTNFLNAAEARGLTVYGHTLAWHSQQQPAYLNSLIQDKYVELPGEPGEIIIVESDFDSGKHPFIGWGNNMTMSVSDGAFKVTNPSAVQSWEVQFAYDVTQAFVKDQEYTLSFRIKGSAAGTLGAGFQIIDGYKSAGEFQNTQFTTEWKSVELKCKCTAAGGTRLVFSLGTFAGDIYIDDFKFTTIGKQYEVIAMTPEEQKAALTAEMERWIKGMMEVTATRVSTWDVVNEAIAGQDYDHDGFYDLQKGQAGDMTNFFWQDYMGSIDYVRVAVASARKYYAEYGGTKPLLLFINDYNLESDWDDNKKLRSLIHWIGKWEADGVTKIDGIGTQMHISYYENPTTQANKEKHIVQMLQLMAATGKLVKISELDMGYVNNQGQTLKTSELTERQHRNMAEFYRFIVSKYLEIVPPAQQYGITQWCPTDSQANSGWRAGEPTGLWDLNYNRKPAYVGYVLGLTGK